MEKGEIGEDLEKLRADIKEKGEEIDRLKKKVEDLGEKIQVKEEKGKTTELSDMLGEVSDLLDASFNLFGISGESKGTAKMSGGLVGLINNLAGLAERSESFQKKFDLNGKEGVIDFHVRSGSIKKSAPKRRGFYIKKQSPKRLEPSREASTRTDVKPIKERDTIVDIFEEEDKVTVTVELPSVVEKDITWEVEGDTLIIRASTSDMNHLKEIALPHPAEKRGAKSTYKNGILEITLRKKQQESAKRT